MCCFHSTSATECNLCKIKNLAKLPEGVLFLRLPELRLHSLLNQPISFTFRHHSHVDKTYCNKTQKPLSSLFSQSFSTWCKVKKKKMLLVSLGGSPETWRHHSGNRWQGVRSARKGVWPSSKTTPPPAQKPTATATKHG